MNQDYLSLDASLAESICTYFYRKHGYMVQPFGIEKIIGVKRSVEIGIYFLQLCSSFRLLTKSYMLKIVLRLTVVVQSGLIR